jgi:hypothetical protein
VHQSRHFLKPALQIVAALIEILCPTSLRNASCECPYVRLTKLRTRGLVCLPVCSRTRLAAIYGSSRKKNTGGAKHRHPSFQHWVPVFRSRLVPSPAYSHRYARSRATLVVKFTSPAPLISTRWVVTSPDACFTHVKSQCRQCCGCSRSMGAQSPTRSIGNYRDIYKINRRPLERLKHVNNMVLFHHSVSNIRRELSYLLGR